MTLHDPKYPPMAWWDNPLVYVGAMLLVIGLGMGGLIKLMCCIDERDHLAILAGATPRTSLVHLGCDVCGGDQVHLRYVYWSDGTKERLFHVECDRCHHEWFVKVPLQAEAK